MISYLLIASSLVTLLKSDPNSRNLQHLVQEDLIPIIGYHQIGDKETNTIIPYEKFHAQIKYLSEEVGCNWLTMNDLTDHILQGEKLPTNACIINFDDSAASQLFSMCSLHQYQIPATFYVLPGLYGDSNEYIPSENWITQYLRLNGIDKHNYYMYKEEVALIHSWGHDIQPHTITHVDLETLPYDEQYEEIVGSINILKEDNYDIRSFAYPYGNYNENTTQIIDDLIEEGTLVFARKTEKKDSWRDGRSTIFNITNRNSFNYIKPERLTPEELGEAIRYTNWWQFEENYNTNSNSINIYKEANIVPDRETSFGVISISGGTDIVLETTFATKYDSGIVIDIISCDGDGRNGVGYYVTIDDDDTQYIPSKWSGTNREYIDIRKISLSGQEYNWYNYYIELDNIKGGLHTLKIHKTTNNELLLDKFRIFAEIDQSYTRQYNYGYDCEAGDKNCDCTYIVDDDDWLLFNLTEIQIIIIVCGLVFGCSLCICMNTGSDREFRKYGHVQRQRELFLRGE